MDIPVRKMNGIVPWIVWVETPSGSYFLKGRHKIAFFKTRQSAEEHITELSIKNPDWKFTIKQSNGVPLNA